MKFFRYLNAKGDPQLIVEAKPGTLFDLTHDSPIREFADLVGWSRMLGQSMDGFVGSLLRNGDRRVSSEELRAQGLRLGRPLVPPEVWGGRRHLPQEPGRAGAGKRNSRSLRQGLPGRTPRDFSQGDPGPVRRPRRGRRRPGGFGLGRAGSGVGLHPPRRTHHRLHGRQRRQQPRHRGSQPSVPPAGQDLPPLLLHRPLHRERRGCRRSPQPGGKLRDFPRRRPGLRGGDFHLTDGQNLRRTGRFPDPAQPGARRDGGPDGNRNRPRAGILPSGGRPGQNRNRRHRSLGESRRPSLTRGVCAVEMIVARKWRIEARFSRFRGA